MATYLRRIVLASSGRRERNLLGRLKIPFETVAPVTDEEEARRAARLLPAEDGVRLIARQAAEGLGQAYPEALILEAHRPPAPAVAEPHATLHARVPSSSRKRQVRHATLTEVGPRWSLAHAKAGRCARQRL